MKTYRAYRSSMSSKIKAEFRNYDSGARQLYYTTTPYSIAELLLESYIGSRKEKHAIYGTLNGVLPSKDGKFHAVFDKFGSDIIFLSSSRRFDAAARRLKMRYGKLTTWREEYGPQGYRMEILGIPSVTHLYRALSSTDKEMSEIYANILGSFAGMLDFAEWAERASR